MCVCFFPIRFKGTLILNDNAGRMVLCYKLNIDGEKKNVEQTATTTTKLIKKWSKEIKIQNIQTQFFGTNFENAALTYA